LRALFAFLGLVVEIAADREITSQAGKRLQALEGVIVVSRPITVRHDTDVESHLCRFVNALRQNGVVEKGLPALEVDPIDRTKFLCLPQDVPDLCQGHRAALRRAAPDETVFALEIALVG
jgi:hypothetical protein